MKNKVLLIGGAGFLGSQLAVGLAGSGWQVAVLDRFAPATDSSAPHVESFVGDLRDLHLLRGALSGARAVVFLAHEAHAAPAAERLAASFLRNIELLLFVLDVAREAGVADFLLFSSGGAIYGNPEVLPIPESHPKNPRSPYGIAKLTMEKYLAMAAEDSGMRHIAVRPSNPYGPGQNHKSAQGLVAVAMAKIARGEPLTIRGDGSAIKDYLFVGDFVDGTVRLLEGQGCRGSYNVGSGCGVSVLELISEIERVVGKKARLDFQPAQAGDVGANVLDISKIRAITGWEPKTSLQDGLLRTWDWMRGRIFRRADEN